MTKINCLTSEQTAGIAVVRDEWLSHGLSIEPADRSEAERGVKLAYEAANEQPPRAILWFASPIAGAIASALLAQNESIKSVAAYSGNSLEEMYAVADGNALWSAVQDQLHQCGYGQHDASWLAFYDFFRRYCGLVEETQPLEGLSLIGKNAGWWWPFDDVAVLTERPHELHRDQQGRLHCETGPALRYPDGWGVWSWHGVHVSPWVIQGDAPIAKILKEPNTEVRRCAIEARAVKSGWLGLVTEAGWKQVGDAVPDPGNPGQTLSLYSVPDVFEEPVNLLLMINGTIERDGTRRHFGETVPANIRDPLAAVAWQIGLTAEDYAKTERRT